VRLISDRSPLHLFLYLVLLFKNKKVETKRDSADSRTREYFIRTQIFFYFHHETYSNKSELELHQHK
jgi:hypothetical protein